MDPSLALDAGSKLIDTGILGAIVVLLMMGLVWSIRQILNAHKEILKEKDARLDDARQFAEIVQANTTAMETLINTLSPRRGR